MSTPFSKDPQQRLKHHSHLYTLLENPVCITRQSLFDDFAGSKALRLEAIETLGSSGNPTKNDIDKVDTARVSLNPNDRAFLMLTSDSTGNAKAVVLRHEQIIASVAGKASVRRLPQDHAFLN